MVLHCIGCVKAALKMWVRNRVLEINRLTDVSTWRYVGTKNMPADLGTRKGAKVRDVGPESDWICGYNWMRMTEHDFPLKTAAELILNATELQDARKECIVELDERSGLFPKTGEGDSRDHNLSHAAYYVKKLIMIVATNSLNTL